MQAVEGPVAAVFSAVGDEVGALAESFTAHFTHMWFFTCVDEGVLLHVRFLVEAFAAVLTGVGPSVRVDQQVCGQSGRALEHLSTHFTAKVTLLRSVAAQFSEGKRVHCSW